MICDTAGPISNAVDKIARADDAAKLADNLITCSPELRDGNIVPEVARYHTSETCQGELENYPANHSPSLLQCLLMAGAYPTSRVSGWSPNAHKSGGPPPAHLNLWVRSLELRTATIASSIHRDAPARRRSIVALVRTRGLIGGSRSVGRFCCRCRGRAWVAWRGWGGRGGIPGRAFRLGGVCGLWSGYWRCLLERAPHPDPLRASFARLDPAKSGAREKCP